MEEKEELSTLGIALMQQCKVSRNTLEKNKEKLNTVPNDINGHRRASRKTTKTKKQK